jgi:hypothetical protein
MEGSANTSWWYGFEFGSQVERSLAQLAKGKDWKSADIRPDAIVGFVPNHNAMNIAEPIAFYCSLWKSLGSSDKIPIPLPQYESDLHELALRLLPGCRY